ncbi:hypothetical protein OQA88_9775 [Cercophora sp. LCS_1]
MASLKFIMDVNDDNLSDTHHTNKRDTAPATSEHKFDGIPNLDPRPRHAVNSGPAVEHQHQQQYHYPYPYHQEPPPPPPPQQQQQQQEEEDINPAVGNVQGKHRRGAQSRGPKPGAAIASNESSTPLAAFSSISPSPSSVSASTTRPPARRRSTASNDSMDQTGYGSAASSSSMGAGLHLANSAMSRPMPPHAPADLPMRLTPITGRVSRAKKGVPVHVCDICKPAKTFTRAEHLRRHQLSHQTPGYSCTYPGCDRAFHRPDLLARHQQRHEVEGDKVSSKSGGNDEDQRGSSAPSSIDDGYPQRAPGLGPTASMSSPSMPGVRTVASPAPTDVPPTPGTAGGQRRFSQMSSSTAAGSPATPQPHGGGGSSAYASPGRRSQDYGSYGLSSSSVAIIDPGHPSGLTNGFPGVLDYQTPRTTPPAIALVTQGLPLPSLHIPEHRTPELYHHDASPWTSSASDSTYSTPVSDIPRARVWMPRHRSPTTEWPSNQLLSPYPGSAPRNVQSSGGGLDMLAAPPAPMFSNPFPPTSHYSTVGQQQQPAYPPVFDLNSFAATGAAGQQHSFRSHQHSNSMSSLHSPVMAASTSAHGSEALVTPAPALPSRLDAMAAMGRQKEMAMEGVVDGHGTAMGGLGVLGGLGVGFGGGLDASGDNGEHGSGILAALDLPLGGGCGMPGVAMSIPLQRPVRASIPGYLDMYWQRVDPILPVVHRQSFEAAPEDVLRCAMAAVATQYTDNKEDRNRGNQLHEYAWHEAKRVTSWSLQTMQAILLCEYFARFRGRKASTRPSKLFESLYQRVSSLQFFAASSSSSSSWSSSLPLASRESSSLWLVDTNPWSCASSPASDVSSCDSITPTAATTAPYVTLQPASYASSTASSSFGIPSSPSSFTLDVSFPLAAEPSNGFNHNVSCAPAPARAQRSWSSLFSPNRYNPPLASSLSLHAQTQLAEQTYSQALSTLQVLYQNPAMFDHTLLAADQHLSADERWRSWVDTEARRRLLASCFHLDGHAAIYQQQRRAHQWDSDGTTPVPPVPLFGRSAALWNASSADEWAAVLASDPGAGIPAFAPPLEQLTAGDIMSQMPYDRLAILGIEMLRLPQRQPSAAASVSAHGSPVPEQGGPTQMRLHDGRHQDTVRESLALDVEERISTLFAGCPIANTYLALHHTPLHDLLAVGGDSWVFSQKVLPATSFIEHQKRLKSWAEQHTRPSAPSSSTAVSGLNAAKATVYAARAIIGFLERGYSVSTPPVDRGMPSSPWSTDLSDYWALYVCALICWAFSHRARAAVPTPDGRHAHQRSSSEGSLHHHNHHHHPNQASRLLSAATVQADEEALTWLRMVAAENTHIEDVVRSRGRHEAAGVVGLVKRWLESDCIGGRSRLYVDAVGVLRKLDEGANWKWF